MVDGEATVKPPQTSTGGSPESQEVSTVQKTQNEESSQSAKKPKPHFDSQSLAIQREAQANLEKQRRVKNKLQALIPPELQTEPLKKQIEFLAQKEQTGASIILSQAVQLIETPTRRGVQDLKQLVRQLEKLELNEDTKEAYKFLLKGGIYQVAQNAQYSQDELNVLRDELVETSGKGLTLPDMLFDEADTRFTILPDEMQKAIRRANNYLRVDPEGLTEHALEGVFNSVAEAAPRAGQEAVTEATRRQVLETLRNLRSQVTRLEQTQRRYERVTGSPEQARQFADREVDQKEEYQRDFVNLITDPAYMSDVNAGTRSNDLRERLVGIGTGINTRSSLVDQLEQIRQLRDTLTNPEDAALADRAIAFVERRISHLEQTTPDVVGARLEDAFDTIGLTESDKNFINKYLSSPEGILRFIKEQEAEGKIGFTEFDKALSALYTKLFKSATASTRSFFQHNWSIYTHEPINVFFTSKLEIARQYFLQKSQIDKQEINGKMLGRIPGFDKQAIARKEDDVSLSEALEYLKHKFDVRREFVEYTHNVYVILQTRGELKDLAGYAERVQSTDMETLFQGESLLPTVVHIYEQELTRLLAKNNWEISPTLFTVDAHGNIEIEQHVVEIAKKFFPQTGPDKVESWQIEQAIAEARGVVLGITAIAIDRMAEARPPTGRTGRFAASYFGEKILGVWNPLYHTGQRWPAISKRNFEFLYMQAFQEGDWTKLWDPKDLQRVKHNFENEQKMSFTYEGLAGLPIIHIANLYGLAGLFGRGGWRIASATDYLKVMKEDDSKKVDWEKTWENLKKGGTSLVYHWIDARAEDEGKIPEEQAELDALKKKAEARSAAFTKDEKLTPKESYDLAEEERKIKLKYKERRERSIQERRIELKRKLFELVRGRNPLKFVFFDKDDINDKKSLRERTFVAAFGQNEDKSDLDKIEQNCLLITEKLVKEKKWKRTDLTDQELEELIPDATELDRAKRYWDALITEIDKPVVRNLESDDFRVPDERYDSLRKKISYSDGRTHLSFKSMVEEFAYRKFSYTFGADDLDYEMIQWGQGGEHIVGRVFKDAFALSEGQAKFMGLEAVFREINQKQDFAPMVQAIMEATAGVRDIHGDAKGDEIAYYMALLFKAYFGKHWAGRLPLGFGSTIGAFKDITISQMRGGHRDTYTADEQTLASFVNALIAANQIPEEAEMPERSSFFIASRLKAELGGRTAQAWYDVARTVIPLILFLMMLKAAQEETKE